jgi:formate dehydrogenase maturation protein FdhE
MKFIEKVEAHIIALEKSKAYARQRIEDAQAHLDDLKAESEALNKSLKQVAKGGEPLIDEVFLGDNGESLELFKAYAEAVKETSPEAVEKAVADLLEAEEERYCDRLDRQNPHHLDYD